MGYATEGYAGSSQKEKVIVVPESPEQSASNSLRSILKKIETANQELIGVKKIYNRDLNKFKEETERLVKERKGQLDASQKTYEDKISLLVTEKEKLEQEINVLHDDIVRLLGEYKNTEGKHQRLFAEGEEKKKEYEDKTKELNEKLSALAKKQTDFDVYKEGETNLLREKQGEAETTSENASKKIKEFISRLDKVEIRERNLVPQEEANQKTKEDLQKEEQRLKEQKEKLDVIQIDKDALVKLQSDLDTLKKDLKGKEEGLDKLSEDLALLKRVLTQKEVNVKKREKLSKELQP